MRQRWLRGGAIITNPLVVSPIIVAIAALAAPIEWPISACTPPRCNAISTMHSVKRGTEASTPGDSPCAGPSKATT